MHRRQTARVSCWQWRAFSLCLCTERSCWQVIATLLKVTRHQSRLVTRRNEPQSSNLPIITPIISAAMKYAAAGMTKLWTLPGTEAEPLGCAGVDESVSDKASLRSLAPSVCNRICQRIPSSKTVEVIRPMRILQCDSITVIHKVCNTWCMQCCKPLIIKYVTDCATSTHTMRCLTSV